MRSVTTAEEKSSSSSCSAQASVSVKNKWQTFGGTVYCLVIRKSWRESSSPEAAALTITLTAIARYRAQLCAATLMSWEPSRLCKSSNFLKDKMQH